MDAHTLEEQFAAAVRAIETAPACLPDEIFNKLTRLASAVAADIDALPINSETISLKVKAALFEFGGVEDFAGSESRGERMVAQVLKYLAA